MPPVGGRYAGNGITQDYLIIIAHENRTEKTLKQQKKQQQQQQNEQTNKNNNNNTQKPTRHTSMQVEFGMIEKKGTSF